jgi:hypothetical protein
MPGKKTEYPGSSKHLIRPKNKVVNNGFSREVKISS